MHYKYTYIYFGTTMSSTITHWLISANVSNCSLGTILADMYLNEQYQNVI